MGKTVSAADMLSAGRRRRDDAEPDHDNEASRRLDASTTAHSNAQTSKQLDAETPERLDDPASRARDNQTPQPLSAAAPKRLDDSASEHPDVSVTNPLDVAPTRRLVVAQQPAAPTFERSTVFFTPQQREWIKRTTKSLPDGLSMSDVVRLAVSRLIVEVGEGLELVPALAAQAHADALVFTGRRNRGLPPAQQDQSA